PAIPLAAVSAFCPVDGAILLNTLTGVMMPYFTSAFGVFLMRQAFLAIPKELEEAALMEGCLWWQVLFRVLLPMSWPSVLACGFLPWIKSTAT
ncbi:carbohydrate ABC transporter permease, partial [Klebsiella pneumoniae]|uniref:ABC transporter permease subunit n=1 Tax=Klebsiella pneumoniae TaxID=573 RepID=UPI002108C443